MAINGGSTLKMQIVLLLAFFIGLTEGLTSQSIPEAHFENLPNVAYINESFQFNVTWEEINGDYVNENETFAQMEVEEHLIEPYIMGPNFATFNYTFTNTSKPKIGVFGFMVTHKGLHMETGHYTIVIKPERVRSVSSSTTILAEPISTTMPTTTQYFDSSQSTKLGVEPISTTMPTTAQDSSESSTNIGLAIGVPITVVVLIVAGLVVIYYRKKSKESQETGNRSNENGSAEEKNPFIKRLFSAKKNWTD